MIKLLLKLVQYPLKINSNSILNKQLQSTQIITKFQYQFSQQQPPIKNQIDDEIFDDFPPESYKNTEDKIVQQYEKTYNRVQNSQQGIICYICRKPGHIAPKCPNREKSANYQQKSQTEIICYLCKQPGHIAPKCPTKNGEYQQKSQVEIICYLCKQPGHIAPKCPTKNGEFQDQGRTRYNPTNPSDAQKNMKFNPNYTNCYICKQTGHYANNCPEKGQKSDISGITCFKCNQQGHYANKCPNEAVRGQGNIVSDGRQYSENFQKRVGNGEFEQ